MKRRSIILGVTFILFATWGIVVFYSQRHHPLSRWDAAVIVLSDGRVLLAGGDCYPHHFRWMDLLPSAAQRWWYDRQPRYDYFGDPPPRPSVSDCDIFDPKTETWSATGSLVQPDSYMNLILLKNGAVFGMGKTGITQIYESGQWRLVRVFGAGHVCAPLPSGEILIVGDKKCQIYNPQSDSWRITTLVGPLSKPFIQSLKDGRVLLIDDTSNVRPLMLYDPKRSAWTPSLPFLPQRWRSFAHVLLPDGRLFICGRGDRYNLNYDVPGSVMFDLQEKWWQYESDMPAALGNCQAVALPDGRVLVAGGSSTPSSFLYDPKSDRWSSTGVLHDPDDGFSMVLLPDGRVLAFEYKDTQVYVPHTGVWTVVQDGRK